MKAKNILISGASIAGPALALMLNRYGFNTTIIERAPAIREGGYAIDFRGSAIDVLKHMGIEDEIRKCETRSGKITMVNKRNKVKARMPDGFTSGELEIMRGDLANILYNATKGETEYIFNDTIVGLQQDDDGVNVIFARNHDRRFDLVIGADGLHSNVRGLVFGDESKYIHHLGLYVAIFTTPNYLNLGMDGVYYGMLGKKAGIFGARKSTEARASFYFASEPLFYNRHDSEQQKQILRDKFAGEEWEVPAMLKLMDKAPDFYFDSISQIRMDRWSRGRVALLGDAAFCGSPMSGMGASMAIVGAYVLAGELAAANGDHSKAFAEYERIMRPFVTNCQALADGVKWFVPTTRLRRWMSNMLWKVLPHTPWKNMMIEMPMKAANSIVLKKYAEIEEMIED